MAKRPSRDPAVKTTLIIAPLALLNQWKLEIEEKSGNGMSAYIYHGSNKTRDRAELQKYDVVLTTYTVRHSIILPSICTYLLTCGHKKDDVLGMARS